MPTNPLNALMPLLRRAVRGDEATWADGDLLEAFLTDRGGPAIDALVRRHGPMVWGVCRRLAASHHDAEDAFQATFLVLVRKAQGIVPRSMLANWLYGVALRTARKGRATAARRRGRETPVAEVPDRAAPDGPSGDDLRSLLDRELELLPAPYRIAIVACDLEGKTRTEAAAHLGLAEGTVASRLARARALLAKRLARRGLGVTGGSLGAVLSQAAGAAAVPAAVRVSTIQAVRSCARGHAVATPAAVSKLTEGVLNTMAVTKLRTTILTGLVATVISLAGGAFVAGAWAGDPPAEPTADRPARGAAGETPKESAGTCTITAAGEWVRVRVAFGDRVYHAAGLQVTADKNTVGLVLESTSRGRVQVITQHGDGRIEGATCDKIVFDVGKRKADFMGAKSQTIPHRIGRVVLRNETKISDQEILDKVTFLKPGEVLQYPWLEKARTSLTAYDPTSEVRILQMDDPADPFQVIEIFVGERG